ncbi:MAG: (d)CMP kinase [Bacteroidota bacterium]
MTIPNPHMIIAIDGPAGSGKSTTARLVAKMLGYVYVDTGAMYRAVTLAWLREGKPLINSFLLDLPTISLLLDPETHVQHTLLDGIDVTEDIRSLEVTEQVSFISSIKAIRETMVSLQRNIGYQQSVVMDGRDIGTAVFPDANLKIYMIADIEKRAFRRLKEMKSKHGYDLPTLSELVQQMKERDTFDSSRDIDPLKMADDALLLDTTNLTIEEQADFIVSEAKKILHTLTNGD